MHGKVSIAYFDIIIIFDGIIIYDEYEIVH